jgi:hypothetical protein
VARFCNPAPARAVDAQGDARTEHGERVFVVPLAGEIEILQGRTVDPTTVTQKLFVRCG